ncbi:uncharacterized protein LOC127276655 isoform X2 [Leptopilina boulardi]|uniref:uncharacterized protein LOC127276655 isoform X2 n=1 Tax=Leptopilina boulardi TaxID=63433 RepID=UPI0021F5A71C|nr:uncharacterized protein LOC127276655 isoform X2 [Leptopilina boulardi]
MESENHHLKSPNVPRQDSGVPEDINSPTNDSKNEEDADSTINSDCNITVIDVNELKLNKEKVALQVLDKEKKDSESKDSKDGSDSGVEVCVTEIPRARSNSVDYASSCGGLDEASCDSSLVSCCSVYEDPCAILPDDMRLNAGGEGTSEGGSESSSVTGSISARMNRINSKRTSLTSNSTKKKTNTVEQAQKISRAKPSPTNNNNNNNNKDSTSTCATPRSKTRSVTPRNIVTRTPSINRDRGKSRDKSIPRENSIECTTSSSRCSTLRTTSNSIPPKTRSRPTPDSLPSVLTNEINKDLAQRGRGATISRTRGGTNNRGRLNTPTTPSSEEARKLPPLSARTVYTGRLEIKNIRNDRMSLSLDRNTLEAYATLPRRPRTRLSIGMPNEKPEIGGRSRSGSRETSLSRIMQKKTGNSVKESMKNNFSLKTKSIEKTRIYHEVSIQTGLTGNDIENVLAGIVTRLPNPEASEKIQQEIQTDGSWEDIRVLKEECKRIEDDNNKQKEENKKLKIELEAVKKRLKEEEADHAFARQELDRNAQRVLAMLGTPQSEYPEGSDSFLELETHLQSSGKVVANQQIEIADLQSLCRMLNRDLEKSLAAQKNLLQQQQEFEAESTEMQDFLQEEKSALAEALKDSEMELKTKEDLVALQRSELERQTEECKHLVRISEQRRQENLSLSVRLNAIERRGREFSLAQGAAVSGASVALSGLGNRLEGLVDQLIMSYNILEKDLEDEIFHNEAYSQSNSSVDSSPVSSRHSIKDCTPSPKRGSFVSAVIGAIRNAATHPFMGKSDKKTTTAKQIQKESSSELLDFETEPCLMMESVLEDVPLPDTYSHNMISSCDSLRRALSVPETDEDNFRKTRLKVESTSLTNLSHAILNRRKVEDEEEDNYESVSESDILDGPTSLNYCPAISLVDQVIDVDNLVTKLLKVLRIIQLDNDTCIRELRDEKTTLEARLEMSAEELKEMQRTLESLRESDGSYDNVVERKSIVENCRHLIKETVKKEELLAEDAEVDREQINGDHNANESGLHSSRTCS